MAIFAIYCFIGFMFFLLNILLLHWLPEEKRCVFPELIFVWPIVLFIFLTALVIYLPIYLLGPKE